MDFERLLNRHKDAVYRQMIRVCGNREDAEDALVEAILNAYRAGESLRDEAAFRGWLATIGRRVCGKLRRKEALVPVIQLSTLLDQGMEPADEGADPFEALDRVQLKECVSHALDALPPMYRDVYVRRELEGKSAEETGAELGLTIAAVKSRLHRARAMVRRALDDEVCGFALRELELPGAIDFRR